MIIGVVGFRRVSEIIKGLFHSKTELIADTSTNNSNITEIPDTSNNRDNHTCTIIPYSCMLDIDYNYNLEEIQHYPDPISCRIPSIICHARNARKSRILEYSEG